MSTSNLPKLLLFYLISNPQLYCSTCGCLLYQELTSTEGFGTFKLLIIQHDNVTSARILPAAA